jgi:hypothetical protein
MNLLNIDLDNAKELRVSANAATNVISSPSKSSPTSSPHFSPKDKINLCFKIFKLLRRNTILKVLLPITFVILIVMLLIAFKSSTKVVLIWIETQNLWTTFTIFMILFTLVSFPFAFGYLVLIISSGYFFGAVRGFIVTVFCANLGVAIAHHTIKLMQKRLPFHR